MYLKSDRNYAKEIVETKLGQFRWNRTILHESLRLTPPKNIIQELILAYPEAITMKVCLILEAMHFIRFTNMYFDLFFPSIFKKPF